MNPLPQLRREPPGAAPGCVLADETAQGGEGLVRAKWSLSPESAAGIPILQMWKRGLGGLLKVMHLLE